MSCEQQGEQDTGFVKALILEITSLLQELTSFGKEGAIDLRALPMSQQNKNELEQALGRGEVSATVNALGETVIWETAYSGVWWIRHLGADQKIIGEQIAVTTIPDLLLTHTADAKAALERLQYGLHNERNEEQRGDSS